jgi:hypothetical protein
VSKYQPLSEHLKRARGDRHALSFAEIEAIVGDRLPASAHKHRAWWSNNPNNSAMTKAWLAAGWYSSDVDMEGRKLVFRREVQAAPGFREMPSEGPLGESIGVRIPHAAAEVLRMKASLQGQTVEQLASDILVSAARLTMKEKLTIADRVRSGSPRLEGLNIPDMIREDRDSR